MAEREPIISRVYLQKCLSRSAVFRHRNFAVNYADFKTGIFKIFDYLWGERFWDRISTC